MKIPAILVICLPIVNISLGPDFKRILIPDKASVYNPLAHTPRKPVKTTVNTIFNPQPLKY